ncbi:cytochrome P450 [Nocardia sp. CA-107356]|uniref:cytochrome P450 n=1 Tax=Nocardia sp. CA-107356 TaxID=3239972 RepID=UPI003D912B38
MFESSDSHAAKVDCPHLGKLFNPLVEPQLNNPYPFYARARKEEPIFFSDLLGAWVLTRYDDVVSILRQPDIFSSRDVLRPVASWASEVFQILANDSAMLVPVVVNTDGKEHSRFRTPLKQAFLPSRVKAMEETIRTVAGRLVDAFYEEGGTDLVANFTGPLTQEVILRMFDIPQEDIAQCKRWSDDYLDLISAPLALERQLECAHSVVAFNAYMADLAEKRSKRLGEDVVSCLLASHDDKARPLSRAEVVANLAGVLMAGHETTTGMLSSALYRLLSPPGRWRHVCMNPRIIPSAIEEALRFDGANCFYRTALRDVQVGGIFIPEGSLLLLASASANHDEAHFENAEQFDLGRSPNQHLAFGHGTHYCVGASLGRLEGRIAVEVLSQRLPDLRLQPDQQISYRPNLLGRRLDQLIVTWGQYAE